MMTFGYILTIFVVLCSVCGEWKNLRKAKDKGDVITYIIALIVTGYSTYFIIHLFVNYLVTGTPCT